MRKATSGFKKPEPPQAPVIKPVPLALNIHAAVEYTGLTNNYIEAALRAGKIPYKMVGGAKYMDRADLNGYWYSLPYVTGREHLRSLPDEQLEIFLQCRLRDYPAVENIPSEKLDPNGVVTVLKPEAIADPNFRVPKRK